MKSFSFNGQVSGLMWSVVRMLSLIIGSIFLATIISAVAHNRFVSTVAYIVAMGAAVLTVPFIINTVAKYLLSHTSIADKKLHYNGNAVNFFVIIVIAAVLWSLAVAVMSGLGYAMIHYTSISLEVVIGLLLVVSFLFTTFVYAWLIAHIYRLVLKNSSIEE